VIWAFMAATNGSMAEGGNGGTGSPNTESQSHNIGKFSRARPTRCRSCCGLQAQHADDDALLAGTLPVFDALHFALQGPHEQ
jgi:hypothetical protein